MPKTTAPQKVPLTVRISPSDKQLLESRARARDISPSEMARTFITEALHGPFGNELDGDRAYAGPQVRVVEQPAPQRDDGKPPRASAHIEGM